MSPEPSTASARVEQGSATVLQGLLINAALAAVKIVAGVLGNAYALIADGIESGADIVASAIVLRGLRISVREATEEYHFGYGKAEAVAAATVALMLLSAALGIAVEGVREILTPHHAPAPFTLLVLIAVIVVKEILFRRVIAVGSAVESTAVKSDAWHHRSDAITSLAAFIGISIALIGGPGWEAADDYAALVCALVIGWTGTRLLREAIYDLMDRAPAPTFMSTIREAASAVPEVVLVEKVFARKTGLGYAVDMHVHAAPAMSLHDAHILSGKVKTAVRAAVPAVSRVLIHMEPAET